MGITGLFRRLGEILVRERLTTPDVVEKALARSRTTGERVGEALVALGAVKDDEVLRALAQQQNLAYLTRDELPTPLPIVKNLSPKYLRQYAVCPVSVEGNVLTVATADPLNPIIVDDLAQSTGLTVKVVVSPADAIVEAIDRTYDGVATTLQRIAERRLPQDGRIRVTLHHRRVDIRTSTIPTVHGESIVMRLLDRQSVFLPLENLGFSPGMLPRFEGLIRRPHGILLVTGPTGSGKTTTLYGALDKINSPDRKIITDRKSTRLNSSHTVISYAVFCLKKKKNKQKQHRLKKDK